MRIEFNSLVRHKCFKNLFTWVKHKFKYKKKIYFYFLHFLVCFKFQTLHAIHRRYLIVWCQIYMKFISLVRQNCLIFDIFTNAKHEWYIYRKTLSNEWNKFHTPTSKALYLLFTVLDFYLVFLLCCNYIVFFKF